MKKFAEVYPLCVSPYVASACLGGLSALVCLRCCLLVLHALCAFIAFNMLSYAFHTLSYAFHTLSYTFIRFHTLPYAFYMLSYTFIRF